MEVYVDLQLSMDKCLCTGFDPLWADRVTLTMRALLVHGHVNIAVYGAVA